MVQLTEQLCSYESLRFGIASSEALSAKVRSSGPKAKECIPSLSRYVFSLHTDIAILAAFSLAVWFSEEFFLIHMSIFARFMKLCAFPGVGVLLGCGLAKLSDGAHTDYYRKYVHDNSH